MKKIIDKEKSLRLGAATLSLLSFMSGCGYKNSNDKQNKEDIQIINTLLKNNEKTYEIEEAIKISDKLNKSLVENDLLGELKIANGVEYYNYDVKNKELLEIDNYSFDEILVFGENIDNFTEVQKLFFRAYLNNWLYHNNLLVTSENLERAIISYETGADFIPYEEATDKKLYINETRSLIDEKDSIDIPDYQIVEEYYNISEEAAKDITSIVKSTPQPEFLTAEFNNYKTPEFGTEDYIPELIKEIEANLRNIRIKNWKYYENVLEQPKQYKKIK